MGESTDKQKIKKRDMYNLLWLCFILLFNTILLAFILTFYRMLTGTNSETDSYIFTIIAMEVITIYSMAIGNLIGRLKE